MIFSLCFVLWLTLMKHQSVTKKKYWHTIFSQLFSFTLRYKLYLSKYSSSRLFFFLHVLCVFDRLDAPKLKSVLCLSVLERAAHADTHTHAHTYTGNSVSRADCTFNILLSNMSSNLVTVKTCVNTSKRRFRCSFPLHCKHTFCWYWFNLLGNGPNARIWILEKMA